MFASRALAGLASAVLLVGCVGAEEAEDIGELSQPVVNRGCGTPDLPVVEKALAEELIAMKLRSMEGLFKPGGAVPVSVWFHVIYDVGRNGEIGNLSDQVIADQIQILNDSFGGAFSFTLAGTTRTQNRQWFGCTGGKCESSLKTALKRGGPETLNLYSNNMRQNLLGWAYLPADVIGTEYEIYDGVMIHYRTLLGAPGAFTNYGAGDTATHEVGHWLNLFHTFDGGCSEPGDFAADTPQEASPASGCPTGRDSCPDDPGLDPIENFMDYTYDVCMDRFSPDQSARMAAAWELYRAPI